MNAVVLIPAYEPGEALIRVVEGLLAHPFKKIVVVNDGCGDSKKPIFDQLEALSDKVQVLRHAVNLGKGAALKTGFNYILLNHPGVTTIVTADADGQHRVPDILKVAQAGLDNPNALVIGGRTFVGKVPLRSKFGNELTKKVFWFFSGLSLGDTQSGLRALPPALARQLMKIKANGYEFEMETLINIKHWEIPCEEVPVETIYENNNASSHFDPFKDSMRIYFVFIRYTASSLISFAVDYFLFFLVYYPSRSIYTATYTARFFSMIVNFLLNKKTVFKSEEKLTLALAQYLVLVVFSAILSSVFTTALFHYVGLPLAAAKVLSDGSLYFINFAIQREIIFRQSAEA